MSHQNLTPRLTVALAVIATLGLIAMPAQANLITNGSFEDVGDSAGDQAIPDWTVTNYDGDSDTPSVKDKTESSATDGNSFLEFNIIAPHVGTGNAQVSQTFSTVAGATYILEFDLGSEFGLGTDVHHMDVEVTGSTTLLDKTFSVTDTGGDDIQTEIETFTADSASTILTFADVTGRSAKGHDGSGSGDNSNLLLDRVSVVIPEPATLALLGLGGAVMLTGRKRRA